IGTKSLPSAPRPCNQMTLATGEAPVASSTHSRRFVDMNVRDAFKGGHCKRRHRCSTIGESGVMLELMEPGILIPPSGSMVLFGVVSDTLHWRAVHGWRDARADARRHLRHLLHDLGSAVALARRHAAARVASGSHRGATLRALGANPACAGPRRHAFRRFY